MIGNGTTAALNSTTALASTGGQARRSTGSDGGFAETLDQAIKGEQAGASGKGESEAAETVPASPDAGRTKQVDFLATARWRNVAGEEASTGAPETAGDEVAAEQTASVPEIAEAVQPSLSPVADAPGEETSLPSEADDGEAGASAQTARSTVANPEVAVASGNGEDMSIASGESDVPADAAPKKPDVVVGATVAEAQVPPTEAGDRSSTREAAEMAAASVATGRARKAASPDQPEPRGADRASPAPVAADTASKPAVRTPGETAAGAVEASPARTGAATPPASTAPGSDTSIRAPELTSDTKVNTGGKAEPAVAADTALDRAPKTNAATAQATATPAQAAVADKPATTAPVFQMTQASATSGTASPAGQVADAVMRDLEELAPTRVVVTANGASNRPVRSMQLQLNPAELGTVNIRLHSVDGQLHVAIRAESDKTAEMLSRDSDAIRSALRAAGVSSSDITVSVNRNDQAPQQFTGQNRDNSGQFAGQDNRGNTSNESRNPNREAQSGHSNGPLGRGHADTGDADGNDRLFI